MTALQRYGLDLVLRHDDELLFAATSVAVDVDADDGAAIVEDFDVFNDDLFDVTQTLVHCLDHASVVCAHNESKTMMYSGANNH